MKALITKISQIRYIKEAIEEKSDLSDLKKRPDLKTIIGIFAILFSFIIGLPAVAFIGTLAIALERPFLFVVYGPVIYGFSYLILVFGVYLAGAKYTKVFFKWFTRVFFLKIMKTFNIPLSPSDNEDSM